MFKNLLNLIMKYKVIAAGIAIIAVAAIGGTIYGVYQHNQENDVPKIVEGFNSETGELVTIDTDSYNDVSEEIEEMEGTFYIKEDQTRIRKANNVNSAELIVLNKNEKISVTGKTKDNTWYRISLNDQVGYVPCEKVTDKPIVEETATTPKTETSSQPQNNNSNNTYTGNINTGTTTTPKTETPKTETPKTYAEGIDSDFTKTVSTYFAEPNTIYKGIKTGDFENLTYSVAVGGTSIQNAINQVSNMTWRENGQTMQMGEEAVDLEVTIYNVVVNQYNISNQSAMDFVNNNGSKSLTGEYNCLYAYRHKDGSLTITILSCSFREHYI